MKKLGYSKIAVTLKNFEICNSVVANQPLKDRNITAFIPTFKIARQGIIKNVPTDITEDEIREGIGEKHRINNIKRLNRRIRTNGESQLVPSQTISITFLGQGLPKYIHLYNVKHEISPFVPPVKICFACFRFGHIMQQCRGHKRCVFCTQKAHGEGEECPRAGLSPICANCGGFHKSPDQSCPSFTKQKHIRALAAARNIPLIEAREIIDNQGKNQYSATNPSYDYLGFPFLPSSSSNSFSPSSFPSSTLFSPPTSPPTYAKVVTQNIPSVGSSPPSSNHSNHSHFPPSFHTSSPHKSPLSFHQSVSRQSQIQETRVQPPSEFFLYPNGRTPNISSSAPCAHPQPISEDTRFNSSPN